MVADMLSRPQERPSPAAGWAAEEGDGLYNITHQVPARVAAVPAAAGAAVDLAAMAADQQRNSHLLQATKTPALSLVTRVLGGASLVCDISTGALRPLVPPDHRRRVFLAIHGLAHPGIRATRRLIAARFVWAAMNSDITAWCRDCQECQRAKVTSQHKAAVTPIPVPRRRFSHIHVDLVGPLPNSAAGFAYLFTMIDRSTRWLEAVPLQETTAAVCADALISGWVSRFGVPAYITLDRGVQFTSALWASLCTTLGTTHIATTAYHPQSNGMIERAHRQIKDCLKARLAAADWPEHLPWVLLGLRAAPKEDSNVSSAELVLGAPLSLPGEFLDSPEPPPAVFVRKLRTAPPPPPTRPLPSPQGPAQLPAVLLTASHVYVRRGGCAPPLVPPYLGPFTVVERGPKTFVILMGD